MQHRDADTLAPLSVGGIVIEGVLELPRVPIRLEEMLPASSGALIDAESHWLEPRFAHRGRSGDWIGFLTFQSYLVRTAHHTILVDTCVGNHKDRGGYEPFHGMDTPWLDRLAASTAEWLEADPDTPLALMGDFNIAPFDTDVWDMDEFVGSTHVSQAERQAFEAFEQIGLVDVVRPLVPTGYTYWDYQQLRFPRNEGMRIDFILGSEGFAELVSGAEIVRDERKGEGPSDHVPVVVTLDV